jgi:AmmeMemoRadiSam system protein A
LVERVHDPASSATRICIADDEAELLLDVAETAIRAGLAGTPAPEIDTSALPPALQQQCGVFVTLHVAGELNGCIGNITGSPPLVTNVAELAIKAAFEDPRLPALRHRDLAQLDIEISLLSALVEVPARSRVELLQQLQRGEDGLVIRSGFHQALFLPSVWEQLPEPDRFLVHLFRKAGLPADVWPDDLVAAVFTTTTFHRDLG